MTGNLLHDQSTGLPADSRKKCKAIIAKMKAGGHDVTDQYVDSWSDEETRDFLDNYEAYYK